MDYHSLSHGERRCKYIPMRLTAEERQFMTILENALDVCEYTDIVDVTFSHLRTSKQSRIMSSLVDLLAIQCGLIMSNDLTKGEALLVDKSLDQNVPLFSKIFEIGRRYKIMNPSKMRDTYGKLMYVCMDTKNLNTTKKLEFVDEIKTVYRFLQGTGCEDLMNDPLLETATQVLDHEYKDDFDMSSDTSSFTDPDALDVEDDIDAKSSALLASALPLTERRKMKADAYNQLVNKYSQMSAKLVGDGSGVPVKPLSKEDIELVIQSVADNEAFMNANVRPVQEMLDLLEKSFTPNSIESEVFSLELKDDNPHSEKKKSTFSSYSSSYFGFSSNYRGRGACLSHNHKTQYNFVYQSLTLWKEIMSNMPRLWLAADHDMMNEYYRLADTGQGYQRLQSCPKVGGLMNAILRNVQGRVGPWVGLSVIHLGDRDVPNALVFIDKYTQVPRILTPIVQCIKRLPNVLHSDPAFHSYVKEGWTSIDGLRKQILCDFFRHGFDGSGDDGGSCIDGRLTSTWNWCSKLHKKPYYYVFMFTGFQGFDGDWKQD